ncbi:hypothetical protein AYY19_03555 [Photobacterium aquimaris]|uniref:hypothetical protein n=1 Tax=Photobacterium aquimaris TaxID=512643 RepID=UPI0007EF6DC0|nr:hypothetical protein [Photobacterium aquimaris]OBU16251.1 hypothetical protein AYY19_03555 [Photobacterium aquimaris]PSW02346.1 hypothetical protein CTM91_04520 [Photobacterium aquimaris]
MKKFFEFVVAFGGVIALFFGAHTYLMGELEDLVKEKLQPYQKLLIAQTMYNEDVAIRAYEYALTGLEKQEVEGDLIAAVVNPFLEAISNSDMPYMYEHHTNRLSKLVGVKFPLDYDNARSLGWIYLYTDKNDKAQEYFNKSISLYKQAGLLENASDAYRGLQFSFLASGNLIEAINANEKMWSINYDEYYNPQATVWLDHNNISWMKQLYKLYPDMEKNYLGLISYLNVVYELSPKIKSKPIDTMLVEKILAGDYSLNKVINSDS